VKGWRRWPLAKVNENFGWGYRLTLNRIAVGGFFMLSGYHKQFNAPRHRTFVDELKALGGALRSPNKKLRHHNA
jgi:hypothetical protein